MIDPDETGVCLKWVPGEILAVRRRPDASDPVGSRFELGEIAESVPLEPVNDGQYYAIERLTVPVGLELHFLHLLARQRDVLAESLNYLGKAASVLQPQSSVYGFRHFSLSSVVDRWWRGEGSQQPKPATMPQHNPPRWIVWGSKKRKEGIPSSRIPDFDQQRPLIVADTASSASTKVSSRPRSRRSAA